MARIIMSAGEAARIARGIMDRNREVQGRHSDNAHLYNDTVEDNGEVVEVRFWSDQGIIHDCWITVTIEPAGAAACDVEIDHCGDDGVQYIEEEIWDALS